MTERVKRARRKIVRYKGELARPQRPPLTMGRASTALMGALQRSVDESEAEQEKSKDLAIQLTHDLRGLDLLCEHYELQKYDDPTTRFVLLSLCLARDHVPYFQPKPKKTGPKVGVSGALLEIDLAIERLSGARNETEAFARLCSRAAYKGNDPDSLARKQRNLRKADKLVAFALVAIRMTLPTPQPVESLKKLRKILSAR